MTDNQEGRPAQLPAELQAELEAAGYHPAEIAEMLDGIEDAPVEGADPGHWEPQSLTDADWVLKKIRKANSAAKKLAEVYDNEIQRAQAELAELQEQKNKVLRPYIVKMEYYRARYLPALQALAAAQLEGQKAKSVKLPNGRLMFRKKPAQLNIIDAAAALEWAQARGLEKVKREINSVAAKKYLVDHPDDSPAGAIYEPPKDIFLMQPPEGED